MYCACFWFGIRGGCDFAEWVVLVRGYFCGVLLGVCCVCVFEDWGGLVPCVEVDMFGWEGRLCQLGGCM